MHTKLWQDRIKSPNNQSYASVGSPLYGTAKNRFPERRTHLPDANQKQNIDKKTFSTIEPLAFSKRSVSRKKFNESSEDTSRAKNSLYSRTTTLNSSSSVYQLGLNFEAARKEAQELRTEHKLLINHLIESKRAFQNLNKAYEQKCQENQTLKSIIQSLKKHVHRDGNSQKLTQLAETFDSNKLVERLLQRARANLRKDKETMDLNQVHSKKHQYENLRKVSLKQNFPVMPSYMKSVDEREYRGFDDYMRQKCVQSVEGSAYEIISYQLI